MRPYDPDLVRMMVMIVGSVPIVLGYAIKRYLQGKPPIDPSVRMLAVTWALIVFGEQLLVTFGYLSHDTDHLLAPGLFLLILVAWVTSFWAVPKRQLPQVFGRIFRTWLSN